MNKILAVDAALQLNHAFQATRRSVICVSRNSDFLWRSALKPRLAEEFGHWPTCVCSLDGATVWVYRPNAIAKLISSGNIRVQYAGTFLGAIGIYPTIPITLSWVSNNTEGSLKRAFVLGMVVGCGNLNGVVSSNVFLKTQKPRFWLGHGTVLAYQIVFLLGGTIMMHLALRRENQARRAGRRNQKYDALTEEEKAIKGDRRPDFMYTL
ncbi:hypothetical protein CC79DRAFT_1394064 [Sarocladium strictum]